MTRKHWIDNLRWVTVLLVLLYHVVYFYNNKGVFGGVGGFGDGPQYQDVLMYVLYPWFMPLLFLLAGISARYGLERQSAKEWFGARTRKLLVPATVGLLVFHWMTGYFNTAVAGKEGAFDGMSLIGRYLMMAVSGIGPLWFIQDLWLFSLLLLLIRSLPRLTKSCSISSSREWLSTLCIVALGVLFWLGEQTLIFNPRPVSLDGLWNLYKPVFYFIPFLLGYYLFSHDAVQELTGKYWVPLMAAAVVSGTMLVVTTFGQNNTVPQYLASPLNCIYGWLMCLAMMGWFKAKFDRTGRLASYMTRSSFGLYIVHYLVIASLGYMMYHYTQLPPVAMYLILAVAVFSLSPLLYEFLRRIPVIRWCIFGENGRIKGKLFFLLIFTFSGLPAHAQWYTGMSQKTGLALCIHLTDSVAELYSPMQTTEPIPVSSWSLENNNLTIACKSIGLKMELTRRDSTLVGYWKQGLLKENITFYPADTLFQLRRPQTPQSPYCFNEETVTADYTDSQGNPVHLEGTLSVPRSSASRYPCLVLVSGSGQQNRDEEIFQHRPFLVLADYLASRGIAVLRYDDRGVGASTGPLDSANTRLFAEDAEAMFRALKDNPHVDPNQLGIGGHSEGGAIAPMVAARNKEVKFVVMLAGQGCTGLDVLLQQNEAIYRANGMSECLLALRQACMRELLTMPAGSQKDYKAVIGRHTDGLTKDQIDSIGFGRGAAASCKQQMDMPWMQTFLALDPADYLPKVKVPVLALNGSKDCQVLCEPNQQRIKALCPQADCRTLPGLNHLFQHCTTGAPDEYILIEETFATEAMKAVADFILKQ